MRNLILALLLFFNSNIQAQTTNNKKIKINPSIMIVSGSALLFTYGVSEIIYPSQSWMVSANTKKTPKWIEPTKGFVFFFGATLTIQGLWHSKKEITFSN